MSEEDQGRGWRCVSVWLDRRGQETLEHLQGKYGASVSGALRAGLEMIRQQVGLDRTDDRFVED